jgi:uncharacterized protein YggU (UPF0235/DUF167 family)
MLDRFCIMHSCIRMSPFLPTPHGATCQIRVTPRAGHTQIAGVRNGQLIVKLAAAPVDGAANEALVAALSDAFAVPSHAIAITAGWRSRMKRVEFAGVTPATLAARLASGLNSPNR